ncbi:MAG: GntR family transcriptional regulator [Gammaproteobacteria bacterium]|nr:GntR family transcriptional regulator [Gammaproteobacteria bacterium]
MQDIDNAVEQLKRDILQGRFVPGQRLVEVDIMSHLDITRGRVRDVFKRLHSEGIVKIDRNRGASVRKVSRGEVFDIFEVLEEISLLIIRKIGSQTEEPEMQKRLRASLNAARKFHDRSVNIITVLEYMDENARFWGDLADLAGNPVLSEIRLRLQAPLFRLAMEGLTVSGSHDQWIARHEEIIGALLDDNTGHAVRHARKSMHDVWKAILGLPDSAFA